MCSDSRDSIIGIGDPWSTLERTRIRRTRRRGCCGLVKACIFDVAALRFVVESCWTLLCEKMGNERSDD